MGIEQTLRQRRYSGGEVAWDGLGQRSIGDQYLTHDIYITVRYTISYRSVSGTGRWLESEECQRCLRSELEKV